MTKQCENQNKNGRELWVLQTILLNHIGLRYSGERRALEIAELLQALPVTLARRKRLFNNAIPQSRISQLDLPLNEKWQVWVLDEERRRASFGIWVSQWTTSIYVLDFRADFIFRLLIQQFKVILISARQCGLLSCGIRSHNQKTAGRRRHHKAGQLSRHTLVCIFLITAAVRSNLLNEASGANKDSTIEQIIADRSWTSAWADAGVLGRQAILQFLFNSILDGRLHASSSIGASLSVLEAEKALSDLLTTTAVEKQQELSIPDLKASITHRIIIVSGLMTGKCPSLNLTSLALRLKYQRYNDDELGSLLAEWTGTQAVMPSSKHGRMAVYYAALVFRTVQSNYCTHFSVPVLFFKAVLILWIYSTLCSKSTLSSSTGAADVIIGANDLVNSGNMENMDWFHSGRGQVKLFRVGNIMSTVGRSRLLDEAVSVMKSFRYWGISKIYMQLLMHLQTN